MLPWLWVVAGLACGSPDEVSPSSGTDSGDTEGLGTSTSAVDPGPGSTSRGKDTDGHGGSTGLSPQTTNATTGEGSGTGEPKLGPPYPIVLAHGFFGFDDFAGAGFVDYWWDVPAHLESQGEPFVFVTTVDPFNDSTVRGEALLEQVEAILEQTGHAKVNLVGHSQGGLDARVVAHLRPDLVASVTTVATPHHGTAIADIVLGLADDPLSQELADWLVQTLGAPLWDEVGSETSIAAAMHQMSEPGIEAFNETYTDGPGVAYYSIAGRSDYSDGGIFCEEEDRPEFITAWDDERDPIDPAFALPEAILDGGVLSSIPNDGLVVVSHAKWGRFLGCIPADHLDEVGQLLGDEPGLLNDWDHLDFYADLVDFVRAEGF